MAKIRQPASRLFGIHSGRERSLSKDPPFIIFPVRIDSSTHRQPTPRQFPSIVEEPVAVSSQPSSRHRSSGRARQLNSAHTLMQCSNPSSAITSPQVAIVLRQPPTLNFTNLTVGSASLPDSTAVDTGRLPVRTCSRQDGAPRYRLDSFHDSFVRGLSHFGLPIQNPSFIGFPVQSLAPMHPCHRKHSR